MDNALYKNLLLELECPVCTSYMAPPIRQCTTGHSICETCRRKLAKCPLCAGSFTEAKNLSLEALASQIRYPCINTGCNAKLTLVNREYHEKNCQFRGYKCQMDKCGWSGPLDEVLNHWNGKKLTAKIFKNHNLCHSKLKPESLFVNMVNANNELFWYKCKSSGGKIFFAVQFIGAAEKAESFYYEVEIFKPGRTKRRMVLGDYCQSVHLENDELFQPEVCSYVSQDSIENYIGIDKVLIYNLKVYPITHKGNSQPDQPPQSCNPVKKPNKPVNPNHPNNTNVFKPNKASGGKKGK